MELSRAEMAERRAEVIAHRAMVVRAYRSGRSMARVADDWEVGKGWLEGQFRTWDEPLRGPVKVVVLLPDAAGRVVLVRPTSGVASEVPAWRLPGGWTREDELIAGAAAREVLRETGVVRTVPQLVAAGFDTTPTDRATGEPGSRRVVFVASTLTAGEATSLAVPPGADDVSEAALIPVAELPSHARPYDTRRIRVILDAAHRADGAHLGRRVASVPGVVSTEPVRPTPGTSPAAHDVEPRT